MSLNHQKKILIRGPSGSTRLTVNTFLTVNDLYSKLEAELLVSKDSNWSLQCDSVELQRSDLLLSKTNLNNGSVVYINISPELKTKRPSENLILYSDPCRKEISDKEVVEDPVDVILSNEAGLIKRSYDPLKCKHCLKDKCLHCVDLEPFDEEYLKEKKIKFMSFQTFTRFLKKRQSNDKCFSLPRWRFTVRSDCSHPSWPKGLCSRCQPTALTLNSQPFRHVDYVEFESPQVLDMFLDYWRSSGGRQRFGFLIGQYEPFYDVPLGVKARVAAIYEPPQESDAFTLQLLDDPQETVLHGLLSQLGLAVVGCIFTDLENAGGGLVRHKRHKDTFFLSSFECILAAEFQNKYRSPCKLAEEGYYGSKFVTVVVSGNQEGQVGLEAYQISNQGMSLVSAGLLRPTTAFDKGAVQPVDSSQYVPDVLYSFKDEYGNTVPASADPFFPLDFLLVNVGAGAPVAQGPVTFASSTPGNGAFPIENRELLGTRLTLAAVKQHVESSATPLLALSDFHLLLHLATSDVYSLQVTKLACIVREKSAEGAREWISSNDWLNILALASVSDEEVNDGFVCKLCTFRNSKKTGDCEVCGIPHH
ncbi:nuclear protein localization protein 4 homolog [Zophobas morio]|uniref:nuclear protein localization protein 4 homolog n=1 Tax=Zophobas morio TaxID=2755281 RepID=UPI0030830901